MMSEPRITAELLKGMTEWMALVKEIPAQERTIKVNVELHVTATALLNEVRALRIERDDMTEKRDELASTLATTRHDYHAVLVKLKTAQKEVEALKAKLAPVDFPEKPRYEWLNISALNAELRPFKLTGQSIFAPDDGYGLYTLVEYIDTGDLDKYEYTEVAVRFPEKLAIEQANGYEILVVFCTEQGAHYLLHRPRQDQENE